MNISDLLARAANFEFLSAEEGVFLFENAATTELMYVANRMREHHVRHGRVTWIIDRNSNTTNVCVANCKFCNFYRRPNHEEAYITTIAEYKQKRSNLEVNSCCCKEDITPIWVWRSTWIYSKT